MQQQQQHILILFSGDGDTTTGTAWFAFSIRGLTSGIVPIVGSDALTLTDRALFPVAADYARLTGLGKALSYIAVNHKAQVAPGAKLTICTSERHICEQVSIPAKSPTGPLGTLVSAIGEKLKLIGCEWVTQFIDAEQNVEASTLARAAYVGKTGKPVFAAKAKSN